ncbi:hypothetical protein RF11_02398 [Thelohanellus kitauei]|uniref:ISXO2-like transposase domain-containing protein n=1 Tax=Thelohanellus kitauei TaxID=669202 RepID=A0A0C2JI98_THEKT|nr:hypothetical protein RF11_02398 [Thelohanellus kitauei]
MRLPDLVEILKTTETTIEYLRANHLIAETTKCPKCRCLMKITKIQESKSSDEEEFRCHKQKCRESRSIRPHTRIISDGWKAYSKLEEYGYIHEVVIHDDNFVDPVVPYVHTQNIENMWLVLKRFLRKHGTH